jgi:hypothetical protein
MTTRSNSDGLVWSEPTEAPVPVPAPIVAPDASLAGVVEDMIEVIGETCVTRPEFMKLIEPLRREIAELTGAMNVMRSLGRAGLRLRGNYDSTASYLAHDVVTHEGSAFAAIRDKAGACPGEDWQLLASRGDRGERGVRGPRGERGGRGESAPQIKTWLIDKVKFTAAPVLDDGTIGKALELRALFQEFLNQTHGGA